MERDQNIDMETDADETGSALLSELGLQKVTPLNIPAGMPGPANINIQDLGLQFEEDISIPENIEAPESAQPSAPESAKRKDSSELNSEKDPNEHEDIVVESDPAAMLGCFFTDSETDFDKPPKTPGGESNTEENCNLPESLKVKEDQILIDSLGTNKDGPDELEIKTDSGPTSIPVSDKIRYLDDELGWNESEQSFGTKNHERGGVVLRILLPRLEEVDMRNLIKKEARKSSIKRSKHKKRSDTYCTRRMYYFKKRRKCDFCRKFFFNETCLMMHKNSNCPQLWPYACEKCGNRYKNKGKLREHVLSKCGKEKVFVCKVCNKSYLYERQLIEHVTPVCKNSLLFRCDNCNCTLKSQERLNEHVLSKCDKEKVFKCDTCKKRYILKSQLIEHLTPICRALRRLKCEHCEMTFKKAQSLNSHKSSAHGIGNEILCDKCGEVVNGPMQFKAHRKKHRFNSSGFDTYDLEDKSYLCKFCGKCLKSKASLRRHLRAHSDEHVIPCTICGKFLRSFSIRAHMRAHANLKAFSCRICQKGFHKRRDLERHMACHSNEKPHFCRDCGKSFASIDQLRSHSAQHTGFKSHFCNICGNSYLNRISLKRHLQRVHLSKKNNICTRCGKSFQALEDLLDHNQHEPNCAETKFDIKLYICNDCETPFESSESFVYHTAINLNDQPVMCNTCGKLFPRMTCLDSHMLTHQQTFICNKCGDSFVDSLSLGLHDTICGVVQNCSSNEFTLTTCDDKVCICNQCGEQFNNIYDLTSHALNHIGNESFKFESVDIKSTAEHLSEDINIEKLSEIIIDAPLKTESVTNCSLPDTATKDYFDLTQVSDMPIKFESAPGFSLALDDSPKDSTTLPFNSDMGLGLNYESVHEDNLTFENCPNNIQNESPLHLTGGVAINRFSCNICGKCFAHSRSLRRHMVKVHYPLLYKTEETPPVTPIEHYPEIKPVSCEGCGNTFGEMQHLKSHVCMVHSTTIKGNLLQNNSVERTDDPVVMAHVPASEVKRVLCNGCGRAFSEMRHLKRHICKVHSTYTQNDLPQNNSLKQTDKAAIARPIRERKPVTCGGCGRIFSEMRHLKRHICKVRSTQMPKNVMQENSFNRIDEPLVVPLQELKEELEAYNESEVVLVSMPLLNIPDVTGLGSGISTSKQDSISHNAPEAEKITHECYKCHKKFSSSWSLKKHNTSVNCLLTKPSQVEPISCEVCGKIFQQRYKLNRHRIVHLTETPFKCYVCNKAFKQEKILQNHMAESHSLPSSESSFRCDICGKLFAVKSRLQDHIRRIHRKVKCNECGITFSKKSKLFKHRMIVHPEKGKCSICHLVCTTIDRLVEHLRFVHKEVIDESASPEDLISMYKDKNSPSENVLSQDVISMCRDENSHSEGKETNPEEVSRLETKRVKLKLPQDDKSMLMFEAYESLLLEACPLEPSVSVKKVNGDINHESSEEELVKLEYVVGS